MASIYDPDGERIAEATLELPTNGTTANLRHIKKGAALLNYYFGKQQRWVLVDTPDGRVRGRLHTRWEGVRRAWEITLQAPAAVPAREKKAVTPGVAEADPPDQELR